MQMTSQACSVQFRPAIIILTDCVCVATCKMHSISKKKDLQLSSMALLRLWKFIVGGPEYVA